MAKNVAPLTALEIKRIITPGFHAVGTVSGLYLKVTSSTARSWVLRAKIGSKRRDIGLGRYPSVELAAAHSAAREARKQISEGIDPINARREAMARMEAAKRTAKTFSECAAAYINDHEPTYQNAKHAKQWRSTIKKHVEPLIGKKPVRDIDLHDVLSVLEPIWMKTPETANRVRQRIEKILDWATVREYRFGANPARWKGYLDTQLPAKEKIAPTKNRAFLHPDKMFDFMSALDQEKGNGARALKLLILTNVRVMNVRMAAWSEFDFDKRIWTIPGTAKKDGLGNRMKAGKEFRVPLSDEAIKMLQEQPRNDGCDIVFPSPTGKVMNDMTPAKVMQRMGVSNDDAVPHGFRSTFKTWASERTTHSDRVIEAAMAHQIEYDAEKVYMRGDWLEKRRLLMDEWANFLTMPTQSNVLPLKRAA